MNNLRLLIIEDDEDFRTNYFKQIKIFNSEDEDIFVEGVFVVSVEDAKEELIKGNIDAAIVDLKLGNTDVEYKGNEIIDLIKDNLRFPAFILTANPEKIEEEEGNQNSLFKIKIKGSEEGNFINILNELKAIHLTGITKILGKSGQIDKYLNEIFWNHISNSLDIWIEDGNRSSEEKEKSLLRYTLLHVQEYLDLNALGDLDKYHPAEFYITKPVKQNIFTGDILQTRLGKRSVILTPACDIDLKKGVRKAERILAITIINPNEIDAEYLNRKMSNSKKDKLRSIINNSNPRYHFIPMAGEMNSGIIDFQNKVSILATDLEQRINNGEAERVATISSPFLKDLIGRYSNYYSRQGSPDFDFDEIFEALF